MFSIIIFILILSLLIIVHEFGHFIAARRNGVRVDQFSLGFGPQLWKKKIGDTEYSLSLVPLGGYVKMAGDSQAEYKGLDYEYFSKAPGKRFQIIFCGPLLNYILGFLFFWMILLIGYPTLTTKVGGLVDGYGAKEAGVLVGDKIISVEGKKVAYWEDMQAKIQENKTKSSLSIEVLRADKTLKFDIRLKDKLIDDQLGKKRARGIIGISPFDEIIEVKHGFFESAFFGLKKTVNLTILTYRGLWGLVSGQMSMRDSMTGPLGIFFITSNAAKHGLIAILHLIAVLSVSLAIFNLLPLPILDGGHLFLLGLEKLRKKTLGIKSEEVINNIGFTLMISLALFVTYNDIVRLFGDKISKLISKS